MIGGFRHKGLKLLYEHGDRRKLPAAYIEKIERILARLDIAAEPVHLDLPGFHLHLLKGDMVGFWSVTVSANWRIIFRFDDGQVIDVDLIDYH